MRNYKFSTYQSGSILTLSGNSFIEDKTSLDLTSSSNKKIYMEMTFLTTPSYFIIGLCNENHIKADHWNTNALCYYIGGDYVVPGNKKISIGTLTINDTLGIAVDLQNGTITYIHGTNQYTLNITDFMSYEKLYYYAVSATSSTVNLQAELNFGESEFKYIPDRYVGAYKDTFYLIKKNSNLYGISDSKYNIFTKTYDNITITSEDNLVDIYENNSVDLDELVSEKTINDETFRPIDKFYPFYINKLKER